MTTPLREGIDLVMKIKAAEGPSPELDIEIHEFICRHWLRWQLKKVEAGANGSTSSFVLTPPDLPAGFNYPPTGQIAENYHIPRDPITSNIGSVHTLARQVLPWMDRFYYAKVRRSFNGRIGCFGEKSFAGEHPEYAEMALCIAILRAVMDGMQ